ncbi:MAG: hypothetical protein ACRD0K_21690, partial [Egibacteraceae bacterium]
MTLEDDAAALGWGQWWTLLSAVERATVGASVAALARLADQYGPDRTTVARRVLPDGRRVAVEMMNAATLADALLDGDDPSLYTPAGLRPSQTSHGREGRQRAGVNCGCVLDRGGIP